MPVVPTVMRAVSVVVLVALVGCGDGSNQVGTEGDGSAPGELGTDGPLVSCGGPSYPSSALAGPTGAELGDDDAAEALRGLIADPEGIEAIPESGWRRLFESDDTVVFGSGDPSLGENELGLVEVTMEDHGDGFGFAGSAYGCTPTAQVQGRSMVEFTVADGADTGPDSTVVELRVTELQCTGGTPVDNRLDTPVVRYTPTSIEVLFTATPLAGETFSCIGNPSSSATLHLDEPLGERQLLDLSTYPPRNATTPGRLS